MKLKKGFDINALRKKLTESKKIKVTVKQTIQNSEEKQTNEPIQIEQQTIKRAKKKQANMPFIIEGDEDDEDQVPKQAVENQEAEKGEELEKDVEEEKIAEKTIEIEVPKKKKRITKNIEKGVAILGPETLVEIGDTPLQQRIPKKSQVVILKASSYYMNNREKFINFINSLFGPYKRELDANTENISCDAIGKTTTNFSLLTHQKIVRDYMNLYTPYRGLLLYHGLGSGKTCTSIAIAEGMKDSKNVIIMTPASLRANYVEELKKCGDLIYKRNQYWEWISTIKKPRSVKNYICFIKSSTRIYS